MGLLPGILKAGCLCQTFDMYIRFQSPRLPRYGVRVCFLFVPISLLAIRHTSLGMGASLTRLSASRVACLAARSPSRSRPCPVFLSVLASPPFGLAVRVVSRAASLLHRGASGSFHAAFPVVGSCGPPLTPSRSSPSVRA